MPNNYISSSRFDVIKVRIEDINLDTTNPLVKVFDPETNEYVQKPRPVAQCRDLQAYGLITIDLTYSGIRPNIGEIWWCKRTAGRWVLDHIVTDELSERGGGGGGGSGGGGNAPSVPANVVMGFDAFEQNGGIDYAAYVTFNKVTVDVTGSPITVSHYVINYRPCTSAGEPIISGDSREFVWVVDDGDTSSQYKVILPSQVVNPKTTYWQSRVRAVKTNNALGAWSEWTIPTLPAASTSSSSSPPAPSTISTEYVGVRAASSALSNTGILALENTSVAIDYGFKVSFSDVGFWDLPGGGFEEDVAYYEIQILAVQEPVVSPVPSAEQFVDTNVPPKTWQITAAPVERILIRDEDSASDEILTGSTAYPTNFGTLSATIDKQTNVIPVVINSTYSSVSTPPFVIQIGTERLYVYDKDASGNLLAYRSISGTTASAHDASSVVQRIIVKKQYSVITGPLDNADPEGAAVWWRTARVRTIDRYNRAGSWSTWTIPIQAPIKAPAVETQTGVEVGPRRYDTYINARSDIEKSSIQNSVISPSTITSAELYPILTIGDSSLQQIQASTASGTLSIGQTGLSLVSGGETVISIPTDGSPASFSGQISASTLSATDARLTGSGTRLATAATMTLSGGQIKAPATAPFVSFAYPTNLTLPSNLWNLWIDTDGGATGGTAAADIKTAWMVLPYGGNAVQEFSVSTGEISLLSNRTIAVGGEAHAVCRVGNYIFVMFYRSSTSQYINVYNRTTLASVYSQSLTTYGYEPTMLPDPASGGILLIDSNSSSNVSTLRFRTYSINTTTTPGLLTLQTTATIGTSGFAGPNSMSLNASFYSTNNILYVGVADTIKERVLKYALTRGTGNYITSTGVATGTGNDTSWSAAWGNVAPWGIQWDSTLNSGAGGFWVHDGVKTFSATNTSTDVSAYDIAQGFRASKNVQIASTLVSVTFQPNTVNTVTTTAAHGLNTNDMVRFTSITTTTGISTNTTYYVINPGTTTFQLSTTYDGTTPVTLTNSGTGVMVPKANTVTLASHGLKNGNPVIFTTTSGTTGITNNTIYYAKYTTTNTFTLTSNSVGTTFVTFNPTGTTVGTAAGTGTILFTTPASTTKSTITRKPYANIAIGATQDLTTASSASEYTFYAKTSGSGTYYIQQSSASKTASLSSITTTTTEVTTNTFPSGTSAQVASETGGWTLNGDGTTSGIIPVGLISPYAGATAPAGWLLCDGSIVATATYSALSAVCGTFYNTGGEAAGTFRLPNLQQRFPLGKTSAVGVTGSTLGETGGQLDASISLGHGHNDTISLNISGNVTSGGGHTHSIGAANTSMNNVDHSHGAAAFAGQSGSVAGAHIHGVDANTANNANQGTQTGFAASSGHGHTNNNNTTTHDHGAGNFSINASGGHTHNLNSGNTGSQNQDHGHADNFSTTKSGNVTSSTGSATQANPPYQVVNYIIKW